MKPVLGKLVHALRSRLSIEGADPANNPVCVPVRLCEPLRKELAAMFQQIILVGNLGRDPEMRYTPSGVPVTSFSLAVSKRWNSQDGQPQEKTTWFRITAWRRTAETVSQYLTKGSKVLVVGELEEARTYQDRDGNTQVSLEVTAQTIRFLSGRGEGAGGNFAHEGVGAAPGAARSSQNAPADMDMTDEDIPF